MPIDHKLTPLLAPRSIAFVGASARADTPGNDMMRMVRRGGFAGRVTAVNPNAREIEGYPCVPRLADLDGPPDLAVLAVRNDRLEAAMEEAAAAGARAAVIFASAHLPDDGDPPLAARLAAIARRAGMPVCGSNCMGFYNDLDGVWVCGFPSPRQPQKGAIALVAHSGSVFGALAHNDPRLGWALAVSPGQEIATTVADYIDYAVQRPEVKVVGLFVETARDPVALRRALETAAARGVPVVALKVGRTEAAAAAAMSHTGAVAGSDAAWAALFDATGVARVETIDELSATLMLLSTGRRAAPGGLVTIHDSGGEREMLIDLADRMAVPLAPLAPATKAEIARHLDPGLEPGNPLDAWGTGHGFVGQFEASFRALVADEGAAMGLFCADIRDGYYVSDGFATAARAVAADTSKPIALATNYTQVRHDGIARALAADGVPVLDGTTNALAAVRAALAHRDFLARPADPPPVVAVSDCKRQMARLAAGGVLDEIESLGLLAAWGLPVARHAVADTAADAVGAAHAIGFPVALKTAMPGLLHKSDAGGVALGLADADAVAAAWADMAARLGPRVVVAAMAQRGVELALGMVRDPQFGPVVLVGAGGTLIELMSDRAAALAPFGPATARRLLDRLALRPLLDGHRGRPAVDMAALAAIVAHFSVLAAAVGDVVAEIDVNPLVCASRIVAVDALVVPAAGGK
ncbi:MAG: acetate--CoA ligase family protein [Alphaproteobacteria bacterium]